MSMRIIESTRSVWWRATLEDHPDGVLVKVYKKMRRDADVFMASKQHEDVLECPMHIALDRMQVVLDQLDAPVSTSNGEGLT